MVLCTLAFFCATGISMTSSSSGRGGGLGDLGSMVLSVAGICANAGG